MSADLAPVTEVNGKVVDLRTGEVVGEPGTEAGSRVLLATARRALAEADTLPELAALVDQSQVARVAARKANLSEEACLDWEEFSLDAQREAGKVLTDLRERGVIGKGIKSSTLADFGVDTPQQSSRWQAVASLSDEDYEEYKERGRAKGEITRAGAIKRAKQVRAAKASSEPAIVPAGLFSTIVADPPWRYGNTSTRGAAQDHYDTLSIAQLCGEEALPSGPVNNLVEEVLRPKAAEQAHLYLWATAGHLPDAFRVMESWGFTYKTYLVWVKPQMGMGNYFRVSTELVLFGVKGGMRTQDMGLMNYFTAKRGKHSTKPQTFYELVAKASPGPYLEMFARCQRDTQVSCMCSRCLRGWEVWGNQA